ncbi:MAG: DUF3298 domain-containing protein [Ignavibacterium sp.]|nr:MAG: DUF3298 domain-containing protein [Ignavibacterium sp.]
MEKIIYKITSIILLLVLFSCGKSDEKQPVDRTSSLTTKVHTLEKQTGDCSTEDLGNCAIIQLEYIEVFYSENITVEEKINTRINNELLKPISNEESNESFEDMMTGFLDEYKNFKEEFPKSAQHWKLERIATELFKSKSLFCIELFEYAYLGGAHPNSYRNFINFNLTNGDDLNLSDILVKDYSEKLHVIGEEIFREINEIELTKDLTEAGYWFDNNKFSLNNNFTIDEYGLTFYYNNYEITAYAFGPTELFIPYNRISDLIKPDGYLGGFISD